jgi:acyl carrier protein
MPAKLRLLVTLHTPDTGDCQRLATVAAWVAGTANLVLWIDGIRCDQAAINPAHIRNWKVSEMVDKLTAAEPERRLSLVQEHLSELVARMLVLPVGQMPSAEVSLSQLGLDSLMAVQLRNELIQDFQFATSVTQLMDSSTIAELARQVVDLHCGAKRAAADVSPLTNWVEGTL